MTKFEKMFTEMLEENKDLFSEFETVSKEFARKQSVEKFHNVGEKVIDTIKVYEDKLCGDSDRAGKGKFTSALSEKFWILIREKFEFIDDIGVF